MMKSYCSRCLPLFENVNKPVLLLLLSSLFIFKRMCCFKSCLFRVVTKRMFVAVHLILGQLIGCISKCRVLLDP